ncbi:MAG TPA: hypothetical protein DDX07_05485, partial [Porphyromonadaceae bacterium]|nr:hypothetical protein [Porphyromonadaceae bacterium]
KMDYNDTNREIYGRVVIDRKEMQCELAVECVIVDHDTVDQKPVFVESYEFNLVKTEGSLLYFETRKALNDPGNR